MTRANSADRLLVTRRHARAPRVAAVLRVLTGVLFVVFALPKFTDHARWVADLGTYGLPASSALVYAIGTAELLGGLALVAGLVVRPVAAALAVVMIGAIVAGGIVGGNTLSFTLAPLLLILALVTVWSTLPGRSAPLAR